MTPIEKTPEYKEGQNAFRREGKKLQDNPYIGWLYPLKRRRWEKGFLDAVSQTSHPYPKYHL